MINRKVVIGCALMLQAVSLQANAVLIGVFGDSTSQASTVATDLGYSAESADFGDLSQYDVLWGLNGSNSSHLSDLTNFSTEIEAYISAGGTFMYHDRYVTSASDVLAGATDFTFLRDFTNDDTIDVVAPVLAGVTDSTLDGGTSSSHGYVDETSINLDYTAILNNSVSGQLVDFTYAYGIGNVYYSTIPLDFYLGGATGFATTYAPSVLSYAVSLEENQVDDTVPAPAPASLGLLGMALLMMRRLRKS